MADDLIELKAFASVAQAGGFREAARLAGTSPSGLSDAVRRLEDRLGVRLLNRTTRSVAPTEQGKRLLERIGPALAELENAMQATSSSRDHPAGLLRLNVPINAARLFLPKVLPAFLKRYPDIVVEVIAESGNVDIVAAGCDAGIRYDDGLEQDMIAVPIGPRQQRFATAAAPAYLERHGRPRHPNDLLRMHCLRGRFGSGNLETWEFQRDEEICRIEPNGPLIYSGGTAVDLGVSFAIDGMGVIHLFEEWLRPHIDSGALEPVLQPWWQWFSGPYLYYPGRRLLPPPLRAFVDFLKTNTF